MNTFTDYLLIIQPPDSIKREISRYKRESEKVIGQFEGIFSPACIALTYQTRCKPILVQPVINRWRNDLYNLPSVTLKINGFNYFNHGTTAKTIYAAIERTPEVENWFRLIRKMLGLRINHLIPHIPIATNIPVTAFNSLWANFDQITFSASFCVDSITILERKTYTEHCEWKVCSELFFENKLNLAF